MSFWPFLSENKAEMLTLIMSNEKLPFHYQWREVHGGIWLNSRSLNLQDQAKISQPQ
jgi:hypothetical protein